MTQPTPRGREGCRKPPSRGRPSGRRLLQGCQSGRKCWCQEKPRAFCCPGLCQPEEGKRWRRWWDGCTGIPTVQLGNPFSCFCSARASVPKPCLDPACDPVLKCWPAVPDLRGRDKGGQGCISRRQCCLPVPLVAQFLQQSKHKLQPIENVHMDAGTLFPGRAP